MAVSIVGTWTLYYDWNSDGSYGSTSMTVSPSGTWSNGEGFTGLWMEEAGTFMFTFNGLETTYSGHHASLSVTGVMTTFQVSPLKGSFYLLKSGHPLVAAESKAKGKGDSSGKG